MKISLKIVAPMLAVFMLGTPVVAQAYSTGKHNHHKKSKTGRYPTKPIMPEKMKKSSPTAPATATTSSSKIKY